MDCFDRFVSKPDISIATARSSGRTSANGQEWTSGMEYQLKTYALARLCDDLPFVFVDDRAGLRGAEHLNVDPV